MLKSLSYHPFTADLFPSYRQVFKALLRIYNIHGLNILNAQSNYLPCVSGVLLVCEERKSEHRPVLKGLKHFFLNIKYTNQFV